MKGLQHFARWLISGRMPAMLGLTAIAAAVAATAVSTYLWRTQVPVQRDPVQDTVARLERLDVPSRSKVCAHRANNVPKYRAARIIFECIEIDVVLAPAGGGPPAVYHPPPENYHGLGLEFLLSREGLPTGKLWLDVKDLSAENWRQLLELLSRLVPEGRRGDTIIETSWAGDSANEAVTSFRKSGFLVSYYLPTEEALECGSLRSAACDDLRNRVVDTATHGFSHLSFDARNYVFVESLRQRLPINMRLLTWDLSQSWPMPDLMADVDVYIVKFPHPHST